MADLDVGTIVGHSGSTDRAEATGGEGEAAACGCRDVRSGDTAAHGTGKDPAGTEDSVLYQSIQAGPLVMTPWYGEDIVLLTQAGKLDRYDAETLRAIVATLDRAWDFFADATGREPSPFEPTTIDGLSTVGIVPETCGAGCGYLGFTGIEIGAEPYFDVWMHDAVRDTGEYDHIAFYEFGRNFWFYGAQIEALPQDVASAFATANQWLSLEALGIPVAPRGQIYPSDLLRYEEVDLPNQTYFAREDLDWRNAVLVETSAEAPLGLGTQFIPASLFTRVYQDFGPEAYREFWRLIDLSPATGDPFVATETLISSASAATGVDFSFFLKGPEWRFAVGDRTDDALAAPAVAPGQRAVAHGFRGDDIVRGDRHADLLFGGLGNDTLRGARGDDSLVGGFGDDVLRGGPGDDRLWGAPGDDRLRGGRGDDRLLGGDGTDTAVYSGRAEDFEVVHGEGGTATVRDLESGDGDEGTDTLEAVEMLRFADGAVRPMTLTSGPHGMPILDPLG